MEAPCILVADNSLEFSSALSELLRGEYRVVCCGTGSQVLDALAETKPAVLVLDLMLSEVDGLTVMSRAGQKGTFPVTLATSMLINEYVIARAEEMGVAYLMRKPCDLRAVAERVRDLARWNASTQEGMLDGGSQISKLLSVVGISPKLRGYAYLREAVGIIAENPVMSMTKELYPEIARRCGSTSTQVERCIRNAIQLAWDNRDDRVWLHFFTPDAQGQLKRPSNAVFISRLADCFRQDPFYLPLIEK